MKTKLKNFDRCRKSLCFDTSEMKSSENMAKFVCTCFNHVVKKGLYQDIKILGCAFLPNEETNFQSSGGE